MPEATQPGRQEAQRLLRPVRWFQAAILLTLLVYLLAVADGMITADLVAASGILSYPLAWVVVPRRLVAAASAFAILAGALVMLRIIRVRRFGLWGVVFLIGILYRFTVDAAECVETLYGAMIGARVWLSTSASIIPWWLWQPVAVIIPVAAAMCALHVNRRWDHALCTTMRLWLIAISGLVISILFSLQWSLREVLPFALWDEGSLIPPAQAVEVITLGILSPLDLAWQIWLLVELQRVARRLRLCVHRGRCPRCGYDLRGQTSDDLPHPGPLARAERGLGCPECGWMRVSQESTSGTEAGGSESE